MVDDGDSSLEPAEGDVALLSVLLDDAVHETHLRPDDPALAITGNEQWQNSFSSRFRKYFLSSYFIKILSRMVLKG